jgi:alpha-glucosidase (family GH31 glycosyl hydrolase)
MHNLYGIATSKILHQTLIDINGKRPFALTRANFPGSGTHAGHWYGGLDWWAAVVW